MFFLLFFQDFLTPWLNLSWFVVPLNCFLSHSETTWGINNCSKEIPVSRSQVRGCLSFFRNSSPNSNVMVQGFQEDYFCFDINFDIFLSNYSWRGLESRACFCLSIQTTTNAPKAGQPKPPVSLPFISILSCLNCFFIPFFNQVYHKRDSVPGWKCLPFFPVICSQSWRWWIVYFMSCAR